MNSNKKHIDVVCFGGEDWWYHNRGHIDMQLMRRFARMGMTLYVNSIVLQKPNVGRGNDFVKRLTRKTISIFKGLKNSDAGFWVYSPFSLPVHHIKWLRPLNRMMLQGQLWLVLHKLGMYNPIVWVVCPAACDVALKMKKNKLVYQRADRFEDYPNVDVELTKTYDQELKAAADLTVFVNKMLFYEESSHCKNAIYLDHGVDFDLFATADRISDQPFDIVDIPRPIIGFYGGFAKHTTDVSLLEKVVDLLPEMSFVFVGQLSPECDDLKAKRNVWMLGQKIYEQIPHYGKCFDVAIMPWKQNRWIQACNPIKLKEYLALGKPIVSTPFPELQKYLEVVYVAKTPEEFADCVRKALEDNNVQRIAARKKKVEKTSWDSKAELVLRKLFQ